MDSGPSDKCCHLEDDKYDDADEANDIDYDSQTPSDDEDDSQDDESSLTSDNFALLEMDDNDAVESLPDVASKFLLKIQHENTLNSKTVRNIACCTSELMSATLKQLKRGIEKCLNASDTAIDKIQGLQDVFAESDDLCKVTKTLTSKSLGKHWNEGVPYVVSS